MPEAIELPESSNDDDRRQDAVDDEKPPPPPVVVVVDTHSILEDVTVKAENESVKDKTALAELVVASKVRRASRLVHRGCIRV